EIASFLVDRLLGRPVAWGRPRGGRWAAGGEPRGSEDARMSRTLVLWLCLAALALSPMVSAEGADPVWPPHAVVGLNSVLLEGASTCQGDLAVVYATSGPFLGPAHEVTLEAGSRVEGSVIARGVQLVADAVVDGEIRATTVAGDWNRAVRPDPALRFPLPLE